MRGALALLREYRKVPSQAFAASDTRLFQLETMGDDFTRSGEMKNTWMFLIVISLILFEPSGAIAKDQGGGKRYLFNLVGTAQPTMAMVPDAEKPGEEMLASCYEVDLIDMKNQRKIGTAVDCLTVQEVIGDFEIIRLIGTTTFNLPQGSLTTQGFTTVAKAQQDTESSSVGLISHITGAAGTDNAIIGGTKKFRNATGTSRLSGLVNLGVPGQITFDCIFVINLD